MFGAVPETATSTWQVAVLHGDFSLPGGCSAHPTIAVARTAYNQNVFVIESSLDGHNRS
jgi:hypothetical protein